MPPEISVILPVFNAENHLNECLRALSKQTFTAFEVLLINDGSTDDSPKILADRANTDDRFRLIQQANSGVSVARNTGLQHARGEYIAFVDADDSFTPDYLEKLLTAIEGVDLAACGYAKWERGSAQPVLLSTSRALNQKQLIAETLATTGLTGACWNKLLRRSVIEHLNLHFEPGIHVAEDMLFLLRYYLAIQRGNYIGLPLYQYRQHNASMMRRSGAARSWNSRDESVLDAVEQMVQVASAQPAQIQDLVAYRQVRSSVRLYWLMVRCRYRSATLIQRIKDNLRAGLPGAKRSGHSSISEHIAAHAIAKLPRSVLP